MATLRVVLDTNVLVSGLAYPSSTPGRIVAAWRSGSLEVVLSRHLLDELARVLERLRKRIGWSPAEIADLVDILTFECELVEPAVIDPPLSRDASDDPVVGTLVAAGADYLVTGDRDLLVLADRFPIVTPAAFWERHGE